MPGIVKNLFVCAGIMIPASVDRHADADDTVLFFVQCIKNGTDGAQGNLVFGGLAAEQTENCFFHHVNPDFQI